LRTLEADIKYVGLDFTATRKKVAVCMAIHLKIYNKHSLESDTYSDPTTKFSKLIFMNSNLIVLQVEPAVGAALLAWNAIESELDGDIRNVQ
jgi:hypothetical protein